MSGPSGDSLSRDDRLGKLTEEAAQRLAAGETVDATELAKQFGVEAAEAEGCIAALGALENALGADPDELAFFFQDTFSDADQDPIRPPTLPDDYEISDELGRGGMGVVYRARQRSLDRDVAVKVLRPGELLFGKAIARFQQEAKALAKLRHPNIVAIHDVGQSDGVVWYAMDLIEGATLSELIKRGEVTPTRAVRILRQVASAVSYVHGHGLIHRDLKPQNVLIDAAGDAYVTDFGLARDASRTDASLTQTGQVLGTPAYMSPEQAMGDSTHVGEATDVYALGTILYECLAGRAPFRGLSPAATLHAVIHAEPKRPRKLNPKAPLDLEVIALQAMEKAPDRRYATVQAFQEDLERFEEGRPIRARVPTPAYRALRLLTRHRATAVTSGVLVTTMMALLLTTVVPYLQSRRTLEHADRLLDRGEYAAAALLFEDALEGPTGSRTRSVLDRLAECLIAIAPEERRLGRAMPMGTRLGECREQALALMGMPLNIGERHLRTRKIERQPLWRTPSGDTLSAAVTWEPEARVLIELGLCRATADPAGDAGIAELDAARELLDIKRDGGIVGLASLWDHNGTHAVLDALAPLLTGADGPQRSAAVRWMAHRLRVWKPNQPLATGTLRGPTEAILSWRVPTPQDIDTVQRRRVLAAIVEAAAAGAENPAELITTLLLRQTLHRREVPTDMLAGMARDESRPLPERRVAATMLVRMGQLPVDLRPEPTSQPISEIVALWDAVSELSRPEHWRARVARAIDDGRTQWLEALTGHTAGPDVAAWRRWWTERKKDDPRDLLARSLDLDLDLEDPPLSELWDRMTEEPHSAPRIHALLELLAPDNATVPFLESQTDEVVNAWRRAVGHRVRSGYRARVGWFAYDNGHWREQPEWEEVVEAPIETLMSLTQATSRRPATGTHVSVNLASRTINPLVAPRRLRVNFGMSVRRGEDIRFDIVSAQVQTATGGSTSTTMPNASSFNLPMNRVLCPLPGTMVGIQRLDACHALVPLVFVEATEARGSSIMGSSSGWALSRWRAQLADDLEEALRRIAGRREAPGGGALVPSLSNQLAIANEIPLREALPALRGIAQLSPTKGVRSRATGALLLAEDPELLADPDLGARFLAVMEAPLARNERAFAVHLLANTSDARIHDLAWRYLRGRIDEEGLKSPMLDELGALANAGVVEPPAWLLPELGSRVTGWALFRAQPYLATLIALPAVLTILGLLLATRRRRRTFGGALLAVTGLLVLSIRIAVPGPADPAQSYVPAPMDLYPNTAGCVLLAVSALLLTASAITWRTWVLVASFLVAGVLDASGSPANVCSELATILVVPSVLALLAVVYRAPKHNGVPADDVPLRTMRPVLGAAAFLIVMLAAPALETTALHIACVAAAILWALLIVLLPREGPRPRKGRVAAPRLLVLAYVVPSVGLAATDMVLRLTGRPALALEMDYLVGLVQAIGVGTLYIMIQLIVTGLRADRMARVTP